MILTQEIFEQGLSRNGGFSRKQFEALGLKLNPNKWTPAKGWKSRVVGNDFPEETIRKFLALKDAHLDKTKGFDFEIFSKTDFKNFYQQSKADEIMTAAENGIVGDEDV